MSVRHSGIVLIVVLVLVAVLSASIYGFVDRMLVEQRAVRFATQQAQSRQALHAGVAAIQVMLADSPSIVAVNGGVYNNPARFAQQSVPSGITETSDACLLSVVSPIIQMTGSYSGLRYGLWDESSKLNLNTLVQHFSDKQQQETALLALPGMTSPVAQAILDWLDSDNESRPEGCESDYYTSLAQPYQARNGPLKSVEELLLVRGITPALMFGLDQNRDGVISESEAISNTSSSTDNVSGSMDFGWYPYLTIWSAEKNVNQFGLPRIDLNGSDLQQLSTDLSAVLDSEWVAFILAFRVGQAYAGADPGETMNGRSVDLNSGGQQKIDNVLSLIGARVQVTFPGEKQPTVLKSPFSADPAQAASYLVRLLDAVAVDGQSNFPGRINVNQAPFSVLATLPGLDPTKISLILSQRIVDPIASDETQWFPTWLFTQGILSLEEMKAIYPYVTGGGSVYRAQIVGTQVTGVESRAEVVVDATQNAPRVILWKEMTSAGGQVGSVLTQQMSGTLPP